MIHAANREDVSGPEIGKVDIGIYPASAVEDILCHRPRIDCREVCFKVRFGSCQGRCEDPGLPTIFPEPEAI